MDARERQEFGHEIRAMRKGRGLSQQQLADAAGVGVRTVRNLEAGRVELQGGNLSAVLDVLGYQRREKPWAADSDIEGFLQMLGYRLYVLAPDDRASVMGAITLLAINQPGNTAP